MMGVEWGGCDPVIDELHGSSAAIVYGFKATRIVSQERSAGGQDGRVEGSPTGPNEDGGLFKKSNLVLREA